jgi:hypothetical protein
MSKLQSNDFLNISCIVEDDSDYDGITKQDRGKGFFGYIDRAHPIIRKHKRAARVKGDLGTLIGGGIGYYLGNKLNDNNAAQSLHDKLADNEGTHSLHDILNHHHES